MSFFQSRKPLAPWSKASRSDATLAPKPSAPRMPQLASISTSPRGAGVREVHQSLRELQILLHTRRLYHHSHPKSLESLDSAFHSLQQLAQTMNGLELR